MENKFIVCNRCVRSGMGGVVCESCIHGGNFTPKVDTPPERDPAPTSSGLCGICLNMDNPEICAECEDGDLYEYNDKQTVSASSDRNHAPKNDLIERKLNPSVLPMDLLIKYVVPTYGEGLIKYGRESWRGGFPMSMCLDSAMRHLTQFFWNGQEYDCESHETRSHHLGAVIFWMLSALNTMDTRPDLDDRPSTYRKDIVMEVELRD